MSLTLSIHLGSPEATRSSFGIIGMGLLRLYDEGLLTWGQLAHTVICPGNEREFERLGMNDLATFVGCGLELSATRGFESLYVRSLLDLRRQAEQLTANAASVEPVHFAFDDDAPGDGVAYYAIRVAPGRGQPLLLASTIIGATELEPRRTTALPRSVDWGSWVECGRRLGLPDVIDVLNGPDPRLATDWVRAAGGEPAEGHWGDFGASG